MRKTRFLLATLAAVFAVVSFPDLHWSLLIPFCPFFLMLLLARCTSPRQAFQFGFLAGYLMILGGGYWTAYVLHEYAPMPWIASVPIFLLYAGFGAFNFPIFMGLARWCYEKFHVEQPGRLREVWYIVAFPALFTLVEFLTPKLFPWYLGQSLANFPLLIQISEITGSIFLTFWVSSLAGTLALLFEDRPRGMRSLPWRGLVPTLLTVLILTFGAVRLRETPAATHLQVAMIQGNIGNVDKVGSEAGIYQKMRKVVNTYEWLTQSALIQNPRLQLVIWPETAMPFWLDEEEGSLVQELKQQVTTWGVPLLTGGYSQGVNPKLSRNSAFLLVPTLDRKVIVNHYDKNILLAMGEYLPVIDWFPSLYQYIPGFTRFERGDKVEKFSLYGKNLGITICYEAIVPPFFRRVMANHVSAIVNLTNDSWFGPTNEPSFHAWLTVFRAVENRVPILRVANTGLTFSVDDRGRMSQTSKLFEPAFVSVALDVPDAPPVTFYGRWGDWFVVVCGGAWLGISAFAFPSRKKNAAKEEVPRRKVA